MMTYHILIKLKSIWRFYWFIMDCKCRLRYSAKISWPWRVNICIYHYYLFCRITADLSVKFHNNLIILNMDLVAKVYERFGFNKHLILYRYPDHTKPYAQRDATHAAPKTRAPAVNHRLSITIQAPLWWVGHCFWLNAWASSQYCKICFEINRTISRSTVISVKIYQIILKVCRRLHGIATDMVIKFSSDFITLKYRIR